MNVLVFNGHPRHQSFSESLANAYVSGALEAGADVNLVNLYDLNFNLNVTHHSPKNQTSEPDITEMQNRIAEADHLVFVYPTWWGTMPALLKGFIDRTFTEGFAFEEIEGGTGYRPLLRGKTAQLITTMDTPYVVYQLIYRAPGHNAMRRATLEFTGFEMASTLSFGPVKSSSAQQRDKWLEKVRRRGAGLGTGALTQVKKASIELFSWLKALRLQFYPMTFIAYTAGAFAAEESGYRFDPTVFWIGYLWLFFLEVNTVFINEYVDYESDKNNEYFGPFNGGSRVIVDQLISFTAIKRSIFITFGALFFAYFTLLSFTGLTSAILLTTIALTVLAIGYTIPPLKLSYRGLGEVTVGLTHSFAVILCGYLFMGGQISDGVPWIMSLPLFLAVLPSILLAGIPDYEADKAASKITAAIRLGKTGAASLALACTWLTIGAVTLFSITGLFPLAFKGLLYIAVPHALLLTVLLRNYITNPKPPHRIDILMIASLTYLMWFIVIPLINLY